MEALFRLSVFVLEFYSARAEGLTTTAGRTHGQTTDGRANVRRRIDGRADARTDDGPTDPIVLL